VAIVHTGKIEPPPDLHVPIRQMLRDGRNNEAIARLSEILAAAPNDLPARELLFDAQFQRRSWADALAEVQILRQARPDFARYRIFAISTLSNMRRYDDAIAEAKSYLARHGESISVLNTLKVAHFNLGKRDDAVRFGQRVLELHDAESWRRSSGKRLGPSQGRTGKRVISFSLWGRHAAYNYGAMINLVLARTVYPGWVCRFYIGANVPQATVDYLVDGGAEVVHASEFPGVPMLYARFLPLDDPAVERFLSRDCDSRLNTAEAGLVAQWTESGMPFHVIRDHVLHTEPIMGQLWGGRADCGVDIRSLMQELSSSKYGYDQAMLAFKLWPLIRNHALVHDRYYRLAGVHTVPITHENLGAGYQNLSSIAKEIARHGIAPISGLDDGAVWQSDA
jgi:tetratricopeptide (TPR) repeat protein